MSLHKEEVKTLVTQEHLSRLEAEKNKRISDMEKELETLLAQIEKEKQTIATMKKLLRKKLK